MSIERVYANEQHWHIEHIDVFAGCQHGHRAIGFEINPDYIELAKERVPKTPRCAKKKGVKSQPDPSPNQHLLF